MKIPTQIILNGENIKFWNTKYTKKIGNSDKEYFKVSKYTTNIQEQFKTNLYLDCQDNRLQSCNALVMP